MILCIPEAEAHDVDSSLAATMRFGYAIRAHHIVTNRTISAPSMSFGETARM